MAIKNEEMDETFYGSAEWYSFVYKKNPEPFFDPGFLL
jgi:hypothetical protein